MMWKSSYSDGDPELYQLMKTLKNILDPNWQPSTSKRPAFNAVIMGQSAVGNWKQEGFETLRKCIEDDGRDQSFFDKLRRHFANPEEVYMTLLALYILEEGFADREDEWQLIANKAKDWLKKVGLANIRHFISRFSFKLIE